jgi:hypothetical protein
MIRLHDGAEEATREAAPLSRSVETELRLPEEMRGCAPKALKVGYDD